MKKRKPLWDVLSETRKKECIDRIIAFFLDERDERIGLVAAEDLFDTIIEVAFDDIYNQGLLDAQKLIRDKCADIETEIDILLRSS